MAAPHAWAGKPKKKPTEPAPPSGLPSDLNQASLRVGAMETLYELDASPEQIRLVRTSANGLADFGDRHAAKGSPKVVAALVELRDALVDGTDDKQIATARNALSDQTAEADVELDDAVHPSPAARAKAVTVARTFSAGQLAAYLAAHADQVVGPTERLMTGLAEVREDAAGDADAEIKSLADEVGQLVAGSDPAKVAAAAAKAAGWLRANRTSTAFDSVDGRAQLEASARAATGDPPAIAVLGHWFDGEIAQLLANPQLPAAAEALLAAKEKGQH